MKVTLKKDHTHAGTKHPAGAEIEVPEHDAKWLADNQVIDPLPGNGKRVQTTEEK